jgi:hypothetical protein
MAHPYHHAMSSARRFGGAPEDYLPIHEWFDHSKAFHGDFRHRALRHHAEGIFECERAFGVTISTTVEVDGVQRLKQIPTRWIAEQHVVEDCGFIPTLSDWVSRIEPQPWMNKPNPLSRQREQEGATA